MDQILALQQQSVQKAPEFQLLSSEGNSVALRQFKGRWLVLYFCA
jgi:peroxiredoxin